jgi:hypothetical protein
VLVRAGEIRRPYYAHKHLGDCPSSQESPELLAARAVLYRWLNTKFPNRVSIEHQIADAALPRYCDCFVTATDGVSFVYWIFDRRATPDDRDKLIAAATSREKHWTFLFLANMMQRNEHPSNMLNLTPTERRFLRRSKYDLPHDSSRAATSMHYMKARSIHYIDSTESTVTTFRSMRRWEPPQAYEGKEVSTPITRLLISPLTGEFVHPGERERLKQERERERTLEQERERARAFEQERERVLQQARERAIERERQIQDFRQRAEAERARRRQESDIREEQPSRGVAGAPVAAPGRTSAASAVPLPRDAEASTLDESAGPRWQTAEAGVCESCGERTTDWWWFKDGKCGCRPCQRRRNSR